MKHIFQSILGILLTFCLLTGCTRTPSPSMEPSSSGPSIPVSSDTSSESSEEPEITIAGVVFQMFRDEAFMEVLIRGYEDAAKDAGVTLILGNSQNDFTSERDLINTYISQQIDGIAIAPLSVTDSVAALKKASDAGIQIAVTNINEDADYLAGGYCSDDRTNGRQVGEAAVAFIGEQDWTDIVKIAILDFDHGLPTQSRERYGGMLEAFDGVGIKYEIVDQSTAYIDDHAYEKTNMILERNPEVQIVFCCNEGATVGATRAVAELANKGKTFVFGYDGSDDTTSMLLNDDNVLQAVVTSDPYTMGYKAVEQLVKVIRGEATPTGKCEIVPGILLSRTDPEGVKKWRQDHNLS